MANPRRTVTSVQREFDDFKTRVAKRAKQLAAEEGLCDEVRRAVEELGMEWPVGKRTVGITFEVEVTEDDVYANPRSVDRNTDFDSDWSIAAERLVREGGKGDVIDYDVN